MIELNLGSGSKCVPFKCILHHLLNFKAFGISSIRVIHTKSVDL